VKTSWNIMTAKKAN